MSRLLKGILEELKIKEVDKTLDELLNNIIPILGRVKGEDHFCLIHVALLQGNGTFVCQWHGCHPELRLSREGVDFLQKRAPLSQGEGVIWDALDAFDTVPQPGIRKINDVDLIYDEDTQTYRIDDIPTTGLKKAIKLYEEKELKSVFFAPILFRRSEGQDDKLIGVFAVDSAEEMAFTRGVYRTFLRNISNLLEVIIRTLHLAYYDYSLWPEGVYNQGFLWHFWEGRE